MDIISKILKYLKKRTNVVVRITIWIVLLVWALSMTLAYTSANSKKSALAKGSEELASQVANQKATIAKSEEASAELAQKVKDLEERVKNYEAEVEKLEQENNKLKKRVSTNSTQSNNTTVKVESTKLPSGSYPEATYVWNYLKGLGLNDYVCAGIIGNIMAEIGGQTLDFSGWTKYNTSTYYGICQWAGSRRARLLNDYGTSLEAQCKFLGVELFEVIPQDSAFYTMQNEKDTALYFAKKYERCSSKYYTIRQTNATKALNYFA